jgi:hypothetical protein
MIGAGCEASCQEQVFRRPRKAKTARTTPLTAAIAPSAMGTASPVTVPAVHAHIPPTIKIAEKIRSRLIASPIDASFRRIPPPLPLHSQETVGPVRKSPPARVRVKRPSLHRRPGRWPSPNTASYDRSCRFPHARGRSRCPRTRSAHEPESALPLYSPPRPDNVTNTHLHPSARGGNDQFRPEGSLLGRPEVHGIPGQTFINRSETITSSQI